MDLHAFVSLSRRPHPLCCLLTWSSRAALPRLTTPRRSLPRPRLSSPFSHPLKKMNSPACPPAIRRCWVATASLFGTWIVKDVGVELGSWVTLQRTLGSVWRTSTVDGTGRDGGVCGADVAACLARADDEASLSDQTSDEMRLFSFPFQAISLRRPLQTCATSPATWGATGSRLDSSAETSNHDRRTHP